MRIFFVDLKSAFTASIDISSGPQENLLHLQSGDLGRCRVILPENRMETPSHLPQSEAAAADHERLAYSLREAADLLGVDYFSVYRLVQRGKLRACRALRGKLLVPRSELLRLLKS